MEKNEQIFLKIEKIIYVMLVMISIILITFLSYLDKAKLLYLCPVILVLELLIYLFVKNKKNNEKLKTIKSDDKKTDNVKKTVYAVATIFTIAFIGLLIFVFYKIINMGAIASLFELLSVNIISFIVFAILICVIFILANKDVVKEESKEESTNLTPSKKLSYIVYTLFVVMTCIIPFAYSNLVQSESLVKLVWVAGILSNLIFGILTSAILRCARYKVMSYNIIGLSIWFASLMGIFSNITKFGVGYTAFVITVIISLILINVINKVSKRK